MSFDLDRQTIRDTAAQAVSAVDARMTVFNGKHITEVENVLPAVSVTLDSIGVEANLNDGYILEGSLHLVVIAHGDDSNVDALVDPIIDSVVQTFRMNYPTVGVTLASMEYDRELDPGLAAMALAFTVRWT